MNWSLSCASVALMLALGCDAPIVAPADSGTPLGDSSVPGPDSGDTVDSGPMATLQPGQACTCDSECGGTTANPGLCVRGICMTRASAPCASVGSSGECGAGSRCWGLDGFEGGICWPDCASYQCDGACDGDGSCVFEDGAACDGSCSAVCMTGPPPECPANAHAEGDGCVCDEGFVVSADRTACVPPCANSGECAEGLLCVDGGCVSPCSASNPSGACPDLDQACDAGMCVDLCSVAHPAGRCPTGATCMAGECRLPDGCVAWQCEGRRCDAIISMPGSRTPTDAQAMEDGYYVSHSEAYSYLRADIAQILRHATCETARQFPATPPLATGDLSQADGRTPGTDVGNLRHPDGTHTGSDMDLGYYQTDGTNNLQIVCGDGSDTNRNGTPGTYNDGYYCTSSENIVDIERQAYFFAMMARNPDARVFGIDRTLAAALQAELQSLRDAGEITAAEYDGVMLGYDPPPDHGSWVFHHHHTHLSYF